MPLQVESVSAPVTVSNLLRTVILTAMSFLSALSLREFLIAATAAATPPGTKENLVFVAFIAMLVLLITLIIAVVWT